MATTISGTQSACVMHATEAGWERMADLNTISYLVGGDTVMALRRVDIEPKKDSPEWYVWANQTGREWRFVTVGPTEAEPILRRSMEKEISQAKIDFAIRLNSVKFRSVNPTIPWSRGGLAALIAADAPAHAN